MNVINITENTLRVISVQELQLRTSVQKDAFGSETKGAAEIYALPFPNEHIGHNYSAKDDDPYICLCEIDDKCFENIKLHTDMKSFDEFMSEQIGGNGIHFPEMRDYVGAWLVYEAAKSGVFDMPKLFKQGLIVCA